MRIEQAWQKRGPLAIALWPVSLVYRFLGAVRTGLYRAGVKSIVEHPTLPVVVVGNITVGGTGKSPLVAHLVRQSQQRGRTPGIVSRGYGGQLHKEPHLVQSGDSAQSVGDEPMMLFEQTGVPVCVCTARADAVQFLAEHTDVDIAFSDDGLQHLAMGRRAEIIVIDAERRFGNGWFLPAGPLRENRTRLKRVDLVVEQVAADVAMPNDRAVFTLLPSAVTPLTGGDACDLQHFRGQTVHAIAGIGNPQRFFDSLCSAGITVLEHPKPDHHDFTADDLRFADDLPILLTRKDAVKIRRLPVLALNIHVVDVTLTANAILIAAIDDILDDLHRKSPEPVPVRQQP